MKGKAEKLYVIQYIADDTLEGITNNFNAWLKDHNSCREEGTEEDADDFHVEEIGISYF